MLILMLATVPVLTLFYLSAKGWEAHLIDQNDEC